MSEPTNPTEDDGPTAATAANHSPNAALVDDHTAEGDDDAVVAESDDTTPPDDAPDPTVDAPGTDA